MKSKVSIKGHPIHPILVSFPIAFFTATVIFDTLGMLSGSINWHDLAWYMQIAGIGCGLLAAIPGFIDYLTVVPPNSSGKKRGAAHGILNVVVILLFLIAWLLRKNEELSISIFSLEVLGLALVGYTGWLGGTLVYRNQIGVDIRYAGAGKTKDITLPARNGTVTIREVAELKLNQMMLIRVNKKRIVVCRTENGLRAFDDHCTHRGGFLSGGSMICGTVQCPWHGSQFDVTTGEVKAGPAKNKITVYKISESQGMATLQLH